MLSIALQDPNLALVENVQHVRLIIRGKPEQQNRNMNWRQVGTASCHDVIVSCDIQNAFKAPM